MFKDWEADVQLLLDVATYEWAEMSEAMLTAMESEPQYEIVPMATCNSHDGDFFSVGATLQVEAETPGEAADDAVAAVRRALHASGGGPDNGVAEVNVRQGKVDRRLLGRA